MTDTLVPTNGQAPPLDIRAVLDLLLEPGQVAELRVLHAGPRRLTVSGYFDDLDKMAAAAAHWSGKAEGVYWTLNPCLPALLARYSNRTQEIGRDQNNTADKEIQRRRWILIDMDYARPKGISATEPEWRTAQRLARRIRQALSADGWPLPLYADSGNGAHLLYRIDLPNDPAALALVTGVLEALAWRWDDALEGVTVDTGNGNAARICKLYGTLAQKGDPTPDRPHRRARLIDGPAALEVVPPALLAALADSRPRDPAPDRTPYRGGGVAIDVPAFLREHGLPILRERALDDGTCYVLERCPWDASHTDRSAYVISFRSGAVAAGCHHDSCQHKGWADLRALYAPPPRVAGPPARPNNPPAAPAPRGGPPLPASTLSTAAPQQPALPTLADDPDDPRPVIRVSDEIHRVRDAILAALEGANAEHPRLFQRGRQLVRLVDVATAGHVFAHIEAYTPESLRPRVAECARLVRWSPQGRCFLPADARASALGAVLGADRFPFPVLDGVSEVPFVRPNGTICATPGYDAATRLVYYPAPDVTVPPIPDEPSAADLAAARELLCTELLGDFPFVAPSEQANALALLLLPFVRTLIAGATPLHMVESPTPGSGKSLLAEMLLRPAVGSSLSSDSDKDSEEETAKWITAKVQEGAPVLWMDNIRAGINNSTLANALTALVWSGRILGQSQTIQAPLRAVWVATANNPTLSTEIARRVVRIRIDPLVDRPQLRTGFRHPDLRAWAAAHRGALVGAALTLIRAWICAGQPPGAQRLGSYEDWSAVLGGILDVAGIPGFLANLIEVYDLADVEGSQWRALVAAWWEAHGSTPVSAAQVHQVAATVEGFDLGRGKGADDASQVIRLGKALLKQRDRLYGHLRITHAGKVQRAARWALVPQGPAPPRPPDDAKVKESEGVGGVCEKTEEDRAALPIESDLLFDSTRKVEPSLSFTFAPPAAVVARPTAPCARCGDRAWFWDEAGQEWQCATCLQE